MCQTGGVLPKKIGFTDISQFAFPQIRRISSYRFRMAIVAKDLDASRFPSCHRLLSRPRRLLTCSRCRPCLSPPPTRLSPPLWSHLCRRCLVCAGGLLSCSRLCASRVLLRRIPRLRLCPTVLCRLRLTASKPLMTTFWICCRRYRPRSRFASMPRNYTTKFKIQQTNARPWTVFTATALAVSDTRRLSPMLGCLAFSS